MMEFYVSGQSLKMFTPVTAADSLKYLTAQFHFTDNEWDGYTRWAHFRKGETVYDIALDEDDRITEDDALKAREVLQAQAVDFILLQCTSFAAGLVVSTLARTKGARAATVTAKRRRNCGSSVVP